MNAQIPQTMKRKYVEISTMSSNDDLVVKTEEADIDIVCIFHSLLSGLDFKHSLDVGSF